MPIIESFSVDHTKMKAPAVRLSKIMTTPKGDSIKIFDLRFCQPNRAMMPEKGLHTMEHLLATFFPQHLEPSKGEVIDISPMGCRTGFYVSVVGDPTEDDIVAAWKASMYSINAVKDLKEVPGINKYQCGSYQSDYSQVHRQRSQRCYQLALSYTPSILYGMDAIRISSTR